MVGDQTCFTRHFSSLDLSLVHSLKEINRWKYLGLDSTDLLLSRSRSDILHLPESWDIGKIFWKNVQTAKRRMTEMTVKRKTEAGWVSARLNWPAKSLGLNQTVVTGWHQKTLHYLSWEFWLILNRKADQQYRPVVGNTKNTLLPTLSVCSASLWEQKSSTTNVAFYTPKVYKEILKRQSSLSFFFGGGSPILNLSRRFNIQK